MLPSLFPLSIARAAGQLRAARSFVERQRKLLRNDVVAVKGLMPLLMKARNEGGCTREDHELLRMCLKRLSIASPYLVVLVMPGGFLLLPLLAWWLDRRRRGRNRDRGADAAQRPAP